LKLYNDMIKNLKSLLWSFTIILGVVYSTYEWVKLLSLNEFY